MYAITKQKPLEETQNLVGVGPQGGEPAHGGLAHEHVLVLQAPGQEGKGLLGPKARGRLDRRSAHEQV